MTSLKMVDDVSRNFTSRRVLIVTCSACFIFRRYTHQGMLFASFYSVQVCCVTMTSYWARWLLKSPASRLFTQPFIQAQIKENTKAPRHWPLWGEFTGTRWIPRTKAGNAENVSIWWRHHDLTMYEHQQLPRYTAYYSSTFAFDLAIDSPGLSDTY